MITFRLDGKFRESAKRAGFDAAPELRELRQALELRGGALYPEREEGVFRVEVGDARTYSMVRHAVECECAEMLGRHPAVRAVTRRW